MKGESKIVKWITESDAAGKEDNNLGGLGGWFGCDKKGQRWPDYVNAYKEEVHQMLEELRKGIIENNVRWTGQEKQDNDYNTVPLWDDGSVTFYSWRGWGDLMAAVWSTQDNKDYSYLDFYM